MRICLILIVAISSFSGQTQSSNLDSLIGTRFYEKAESFYYEMSYDSARENYQKSMVVFESAGMWEEYFESLYSIGLAARELNQFQRADSTFKFGMLKCESLIGTGNLSWVKLCRGRGLIRQKNNEFDSALFFLKKGLEVFHENPDLQDRMELFLYIGLADCYVRLGQYDAGLKTNHKLLQIAKERYQNPKFDNYERRKALAHEQIGYIYNLVGETTKAEAYLKEAGNYLMNNINSKWDYYSIVKHFNILGGVYFDGKELRKSLSAYHMARDIAIEHLPTGDLALTYAYANLASYYLEINNDSARWYAERARSQVFEYAPGANYILAEATSNLGLANLNLNRLEEALANLEDVLQITESFNTDNHFYQVATHHRIAQVYYAMGNPMLALEYYDKSIQANSVSVARQSQSLEEESNEYLHPIWLAETVYEKSRLQVKLENNRANKDAVLIDLDRGILMSNQTRNQISFDQDRRALSKKLSQFHLFGASLCYELYQETQDSRYLQKFFNYSEMDKAFSLRSAISQQRLLLLAGVSDEDLAQQLRINNEFEEVKVGLARQKKEGMDTNGKDWTYMLTLKKRQEEFSEHLERKYPVFTPFNSSSQKIDLNSIIASLAPKRGIVEYMIVADEIYSLIITENGADLLKLDGGDELDSVIKELRVATNHDREEFYEISNQLYKILFEPIDDYIGKLNLPIDYLSIIPDGLIGLVSFDVLVSHLSNRTYLMEKYVLNYEPSVQVAYGRSSKSKASTNLLASFAPNFENLDDKEMLIDNYLAVRDTIRGVLGSLPGAAKEVKEVSAVFSGDVFALGDATEENFNDKAGNYAILHLATHALVDHKSPDNSKLILSESENGEYDGYLHAYEIYNLDLNAQLVTLSACNTGFGKIRKGEGVMSLSRAFAYAGVPATVVSLWPASDKSTPELMTYFYQNLKDGQAKDVALNNARKQYLANAKGKARHPFYWGGFVLIGDSSPLEENKNLSIWMIPTVLVIVMILTVYRRKRKATAA